MTALSLTLPEVGKPDNTEDPKLNTALTTIQNWANGNVDSSNFPKAVSATTAGAYAARTAVTKNAKHLQPSNLRPCIANIDIRINATQGGFSVTAKVFQGATEVAKFLNEAQNKTIQVGVTLWLQPGEEWEVKSEGESGTSQVEEVAVAYRVL